MSVERFFTAVRFFGAPVVDFFRLPPFSPSLLLPRQFIPPLLSTSPFTQKKSNDCILDRQGSPSFRTRTATFGLPWYCNTSLIEHQVPTVTSRFQHHLSMYQHCER